MNEYNIQTGSHRIPYDDINVCRETTIYMLRCIKIQEIAKVMIQIYP